MPGIEEGLGEFGEFGVLDGLGLLDAPGQGILVRFKVGFVFDDGDGLGDFAVLTEFTLEGGFEGVVGIAE